MTTARARSGPRRQRQTRQSRMPEQVSAVTTIPGRSKLCEHRNLTAYRYHAHQARRKLQAVSAGAGAPAASAVWRAAAEPHVGHPAGQVRRLLGGPQPGDPGRPDREQPATARTDRATAPETPASKRTRVRRSVLFTDPGPRSPGITRISPG